MNTVRTRLLAALLLLLLCIGAAAPALAHKVTLFAYVEGGDIVADAFYSRSNKVRQGKITVADAATGEKLAEIVTDENGAARFPVPQKALSARRDLRLTLVAGEGHQNDILVRASEFAPAPAAPAAQKSAPAPASPAQKSAPKVADGAASKTPPAPQPAPQLTQAELEALVERASERAVEKKVAPLRQMLERQAGDGPGMVEIVGGIGYILGLFGVAAFFAARRKDKAGN